MTNQANATINLSDSYDDADHIDPHAKALPIATVHDIDTAARLEDAARAGFDVANEQAGVLITALAASVTPVATVDLTVGTPSRRVMRREGQTHDNYTTANDKHVVVELPAGETSLAWAPKLLPLYSFPEHGERDVREGDAVDGARQVRAGSAVAIVRPGYEADPLGIATDMYRPVNHAETIRDVAESTMGRATFQGALIDGHGFHVVHSFRLEAVLPEKLAEIATRYNLTTPASPDATPAIRGLGLVSRLTVVHDHTGGGSLRASVVCYLGKDIVIGSACFTRRLHVGTGSLDVGVGDRARWVGVIDAMLDTAVLQHGAIGALLAKAAEVPMTDDAAKVFEMHGVFVERAKVTAAEKVDAVNRGEPEPVGAIVEPTALDVVIAFHKQRSGRMSWGVWSRRLEGGALAALEAICDVKLPKQLFRRG